MNIMNELGTIIILAPWAVVLVGFLIVGLRVLAARRRRWRAFVNGRRNGKDGLFINERLADRPHEEGSLTYSMERLERSAPRAAKDAHPAQRRDHERRRR